MKLCVMMKKLTSLSFGKIIFFSHLNSIIFPSAGIFSSNSESLYQNTGWGFARVPNPDLIQNLFFLNCL